MASSNVLKSIIRGEDDVRHRVIFTFIKFYEKGGDIVSKRQKWTNLPDEF